MNISAVDDCLREIFGKKVAWRGNTAVIELPDSHAICLERCDDSDELFVYADIAVISEELFGQCAISLLKGNLFGRDTGGSAVLAYDAENSQVVLWDKLALPEMNREKVRERFSYFYLARVHWMQRLQEYAADAGRGDPFRVPAFISCS